MRTTTIWYYLEMDPMATASTVLARATTNDQTGHYQQAIAEYINGIEILANIVSREPNPMAKNMITVRIGIYSDRVYALIHATRPDILSKISGNASSLPGNNNSSSSSSSSSSQPSFGFGNTQQQPQSPWNYQPPIIPFQSSSSSSSSSSLPSSNQSTNTQSPMQLSEDGINFQTAFQTSLIDARQVNIHWEDIGGLELAKQMLQQTVIMPIKFPNLFSGDSGRQPWRSILLYGPPGTGKSQLARAVATESSSKFYSISSAELLSKYLGQSEKLIAGFFEMCRHSTPAIIFIDEIDSLCSTRSEQDNEASSRTKTQFLAQIDGVGKDLTGLLLLAATNIPWALDQGMRRRFNKRLFIGLPDKKSRCQMFRIHLKPVKNVKLSDDEVEKLAVMSEGYSGSDVKNSVQAAIMTPITRVQSATSFVIDGNGMYSPVSSASSISTSSIHNITWRDVPNGKLADQAPIFEDFVVAIKTTKSTVSLSDISKHEDWTNKFGEDGK
jgi:vacuolar protein-sorting-associated protein 4